MPISAQKSFVLLFARAATYRNFFETFMKGLFLASSRQVLSLIDFKSGFGKPRHFSPRFSLRRPFRPFLFLLALHPTDSHRQDSTLRDLICLHVVQFVNISWQIYHCPKREEIDFARYHNSRWSRISRVVGRKERMIVEINWSYCEFVTTVTKFMINIVWRSS